MSDPSMPSMTDTSRTARRFGLAASKLHRASPDGGLLTWARESGDSIRAMGLRLHAVPVD